MFYGWYVVAGTFVSQLAVVGFFSYSISLLTPLIREEFGVSLEQVMYSLTAGIFTGMILQPLAGRDAGSLSGPLDHGGGHTNVCGRPLGLGQFQLHSAIHCHFWFDHGCGQCLRGHSSKPGQHIALVHIQPWQGIGNFGCRDVCRWHCRPGLVAWWLQTSGWRGALENLALCIVLIVLPFVVLTIRGKPADVGLLPEDGKPGASAPTDVPELTLKDIIRHPGYWQIGISVGLMFSVYISILANIAPYAAGLGVSATRTSTLIMVVAIMGLLGKLAFGVAADKVNLKIGLWAAMALLVMALLLMATEPGYPLMLLAAGLLGLASGGYDPGVGVY